MYPLHVSTAAPGPPGSFGLIETLRVRGGRIPFLDRHAARLRRALSDLGLPALPHDLGTLVAPQAGAGDAVVRVEVRGASVTVTARELQRTEPPRVITATVPHEPYPHKTTARTAFERAAAEAWAAQADEALLLTAGKLVAEATVWTVFWWEGETLRTPALALQLLPGVARARIGQMVKLVEAWSGRDELTGKSLFLANAARGIVPVATLDGEPVPPHRRTAKLARRFWPA